VKTLAFHHDHKKLPPATESLIPVHLYGLGTSNRNDLSTIGHQAIEKIKRLGLKVSAETMDFLSIAYAVTAADTFVLRGDADDSWTREITLKLPLHNPAPWVAVKAKLEKALRFLSGDLWTLEFAEGGFAPPEPFLKKDRYNLLNLRELDCVSLFSGGLDSAVGVIDLLGEDKKPLLISHSYKGDKSKQEAISNHLKGRFANLSVNADPHNYTKASDISMRTRSINFLALAAVGAYAVEEISQQDSIDLFVPENGFISLNAPLTPRRIGSLSTRTTHPHFIQLIQEIFDTVGINVNIVNPYQFQTKGEMVLNCKDQPLLQTIVDSTVSCSHWKRENQQCGCCVPCLIRRSSLKKGSMREAEVYKYQNLKDILVNPNGRDDLLAVSSAIKRLEERPIGPWISESGPLPIGDFEDYKSVFTRGLKEVQDFLVVEVIR